MDQLTDEENRRTKRKIISYLVAIGCGIGFFLSLFIVWAIYNHNQ